MSVLTLIETLGISANLASAPLSTGQEIGGLRSDNASYGLVEERFVDSSSSLVCYEEIDGQRWKYLAQNSDFKQFKKGSPSGLSNPAMIGALEVGGFREEEEEE
ncbi:hypothetical protein LguiB_020960 [Lonicera macranthoides]